MNESKIIEEIMILTGAYQLELDLKNKGFEPGKTYVPVSGKVVGIKERKYMVEAALECWLTSGRFNKRFEDRFSEWTGLRHILTTNSGSSANLLALSALTSQTLGERALKAGDEIITVAAGFPTTISPILQVGCTPVFVDVSLETYNIDVSIVETAITDKTRAIVLAHTMGNPFNVKAITSICKKYGLWLVEDCCDALGALYAGKRVGTFGDISTFSFYPAHHITMGEGGAVGTQSPKLKRALESFRDWGRDCWCAPGVDNTCGKRYDTVFAGLPKSYDHKYIYTHAGYNLKISDMQAACGLAQLERLDEFIEKRNENHQLLYEGMKDYSNYFIMPESEPNSSPSWFGFLLSIKKGTPLRRTELLRYLEERQIGTRLLFAGNATRQPFMQNADFRVHGTLDNSDFIMENTFWLGVYPGLGREQIDYVVSSISEYLKTF